VIIQDGSVGDVLRPAGILFAIAIGCFVLSALLYDHEKPKSFFA
jgi:hypothetical protein